MQYRSLCCDSESMFNLVVYSSTHSLVDGTGDAIIQGRATVQRSFLFHCSSPTTFCLKNQKFFNFVLLSRKQTHSALILLTQRREFLLMSFLWQLTASTSRRNQRRHARFKEQLRQESLSHCMSRNFHPNVCMNGIRRRATPRGRFSHFGQSIFYWYAFHRHHY